MDCCMPLHLNQQGVRTPAIVEHVFKKLGPVNEHISTAQLAAFFTEFQGDSSITEEQAGQMIAEYHSIRALHGHHHWYHHHHEDGQPVRTTLDLFEFTEFLLNPKFNSPIDISKQPTQDMTLPLSHYYIYASHNSYLTGNQLTSKSSTAPIAKALEDGYRVIELDCWERKGKIMVLHGNTLTKPVAFNECLKVIKDSAFKASEYPVIITIENHLSADLQKEASKLIREIIGDKLFVPSENERPPIQFASPEQLKNKIIISDSPPKDTLLDQAAADPEGAINIIPTIIMPPPKPEGDDSPPLSPTGIGHRAKKHITRRFGEALDKRGANTNREIETITQLEDLKELIYISCEKPSEMKTAPVDGQLVCSEKSVMANVSEPQLRKYVKANPGSLIEYSKKNLGRMYPFGLRFDSSNADPFVAWSYGFQIAALNIQGRDRPCWLADALFSSNGKCGYVKKPDVLLPGNDLQYEQIATLPPKVLLKVTILLGTDWHKFFDFLKKPDFYVKLAIEGMPVDKAKKKTKTVFRSNEPHWEEETFEFQIRVLDLAILRIEVWENDTLERDDFVGQACFPVKEVKTGIRVVPLKSREGTEQRSKLLCKIERTEPTAPTSNTESCT